MAQVAAQQVPVEVVRLVAVLALDHQAADARRAQQRLVDLQVGEVLERRPAARPRSAGRGRRPRRVVEVRGRVGGVAVERVDGLVVHPSTVSPAGSRRVPPWAPSPAGPRRGVPRAATELVALGDDRPRVSDRSNAADQARPSMRDRDRRRPAAARADLRRRPAAAGRVGRRAQRGSTRPPG